MQCFIAYLGKYAKPEGVVGSQFVIPSPLDVSGREVRAEEASWFLEQKVSDGVRQYVVGLLGILLRKTNILLSNLWGIAFLPNCARV